MKKFIRKVILFSLCLLTINLFEFLMSTIYLSYREPSNYLIFKTSQYPYLNELRSFSGDLNNESNKTIKYITNNKGSRSIINDKIDIAILGDSFAELSNLNQSNTIQGNLNHHFNKRTVSIKLNTGLNNFKDYINFLAENYNKPQTLILLIVERNISSFSYENNKKVLFKDKTPYSEIFSSFLKFISEGIDLPTLRLLKSYVNGNKITPIIKNDLRFLQGESVETFNSADLKKFESNIIELNNQLLELNVNFIVCVVPNKETKFRNLFEKANSKNIKSIDSLLNKNNILNISLLDVFDKNNDIYDENDTHLSNNGSKLVSTLILNKIDSLIK